MNPEKEEDEDRISLLPDCFLINEILSRLPSTKDAIRTGILSKRWQHLCHSVPCLFFDDSYFRKILPVDHSSKLKPLPDFYMWVDKTLTQCQSKNLNKFSVSANYNKWFQSHVDNWVRFATDLKVQQLRLELSCKEDGHEFVLEADSFFVNSYFTHLHLKGCIFNPTGPITWNNLTTLSISNGNLDQDMIANILSVSPLLDTLILVNYYGYLPVDETLNHLKKFEVRATYDNQFEPQFNNWIRFATSNKVQQLHFEIKNMKIDQFVLEDDSLFINSHFTHLCLKCCLFNPTGPITWNNLTHLTIIRGTLANDLIANILSGSPLLEYLRLEYCDGYSKLDITSKSVKNLVLDGSTTEYDDDNIDNIIEINAPYISSLRIVGCFLLSKIFLRDVSSLVKAELDYTKLSLNDATRKEESEEMLEMFILRLHHVKEVKIGNSCYKTFSLLEAKGFIFPSNLKVVEVTYPLDDTYSDCSDNDSPVGELSVGDSSRADLQSIAATLGQVQAAQPVILSRLAALCYDHQRYQPLLERLAQEQAQAAGLELAEYAPPQIVMPDAD